MFGEIKLMLDEGLCTAQDFILQNEMSMGQATVTLKFTQP